MMTYGEGIIGIPKQFEYQPEIVNKEKFRPFKRIIVLGMGGSRLAADILNMIKPEMDIYIHSDYDLPKLSREVLAESLIIANSYSGHTAEPISGVKMVIEQGLNLAIIASGGELITLAREKQIPHVALPHSEYPPRMMIGHDLMALAAVTGIDSSAIQACSTIDASAGKSQGMQIARQIGQSIPLIYTSQRLNELGYIWKVILNETAKLPAFNNRFPEADHNEIAGFQGDWASGFHCIFLQDDIDGRISQRMDLTADLFRTHDIQVATMPLSGDSLIEQIVSSIIVAHWTAAALAEIGHVDPISTTEIENFKKKLDD